MKKSGKLCIINLSKKDLGKSIGGRNKPPRIGHWALRSQAAPRGVAAQPPMHHATPGGSHACAAASGAFASLNTLKCNSTQRLVVTFWRNLISILLTSSAAGQAADAIFQVEIARAAAPPQTGAPGAAGRWSGYRDSVHMSAALASVPPASSRSYPPISRQPLTPLNRNPARRVCGLPLPARSEPRQAARV